MAKNKLGLILLIGAAIVVLPKLLNNNPVNTPPDKTLDTGDQGGTTDRGNDNGGGTVDDVNTVREVEYFDPYFDIKQKEADRYQRFIGKPSRQLNTWW